MTYPPGTLIRVRLLGVPWVAIVQRQDERGYVDVVITPKTWASFHPADVLGVLVHGPENQQKRARA